MQISKSMDLSMNSNKAKKSEGPQWKIFNHFSRKITKEVFTKHKILPPEYSFADSVESVYQPSSKISHGQQTISTKCAAQIQESHHFSNPSVQAEFQPSETFVGKLQQLITIVTNKQLKQNVNIKRKLEFDQKESQYIDKLKQMICKLHQRLKEVEEMHKQTEHKTILLEDIQSSLKKENLILKKKLQKKIDTIFKFQQKVDQLLYENQQLQKKNSELQMSIVSLRSASIFQLKQQLKSLKIENHQEIPLLNIITPSKNKLAIPTEEQSLRLSFQSKQLENALMYSQFGNQRQQLQDQVNMLNEQFTNLKNTKRSSEKQTSRPDDRLLVYGQTASFNGLVKSQWKECN